MLRQTMRTLPRIGKSRKSSGRTCSVRRATLARRRACVYSLAVMTNEERKQVVRELLAKGQTLSQIQDYLHKEKNDPITYMELRLLLSEMPDAKLPEKELPKTVMPPQSAPSASPAAK